MSDLEDEFSNSIMPSSLRIDIPFKDVSAYTLRHIFEEILAPLATHCGEKTREQLPERYIKGDILGMCHIARERIREMKERPVGKVVGIK